MRTGLSRRRLTAIAALIGVFGGASPALAGSFGGLGLPVESITHSEGAIGLETNPALLGLLRGSELLLLYGETGESTSSGGALFLGAPVVGPLRLGTDAQFLRDGSARFGFGAAWSPRARWSVGFAWHGIVAAEDSDRDGMHAFDLGMLLRPASWVSLAATGYSLNQFDADDPAASRRYRFGTLFRPGTSRIALGADAEIHEESGDVDLIGSLFVTPTGGMEIGVAARIMPREEGPTEVFVGATLGVNWGAMGLQIGARTQLPEGADPILDSAHAVVRFSKHPRLSLTRPGDVWPVLTLGPLAEQRSGTLLSAGRATQLGVLRYLEALAGDPHVGGVVLRLIGYAGSWAQAQELRGAIGRLRSAGKRVHVFFDQVRTLGYYVASAADRVYVDPAGGAWILGVSSKTLFYAELLDHLGVDAQVVRHGRYKSFPESFMASGPSDELNEVKDSMLRGLEEQISGGIAEGRGMTPEEAVALMHGGPYTAAELKEKKLVDDFVHQDALKELVKESEGRALSFDKKYRPERATWDAWGDVDRLVVLTVQGTIVDGKSGTLPLVGRRTVGARTFIPTLEALTRDRRVKAIVLRINSPGGSAFASDQMYRAVRVARKKKPVIVSLGGVAASGGYFIAAAGDRIFAEPGTITGSIGIFTTKFSFGALMAWLGVREHIWTRGENADFFATSRPWSDVQLEMLTQKLRIFYERFLDAVAEGRGKTREEIDAVAQGRVWLGSQALEHGLVDEMGGLSEAIAWAAKRGDLAPDEPWRVVHLPQPSWRAALREMLVPRLPVLAEDGALEGGSQEMAEGMLLKRLFDESLGAAADLFPYTPGEMLALMPWRVTLE